MARTEPEHRGWRRDSWPAGLAYDLGHTARQVAGGLEAISLSLRSLGRSPAPPATRRPRHATVVYSNAQEGAQVIQLHPQAALLDHDPKSVEALDALLTSMRTTFESMRAEGTLPFGRIQPNLTWHDLAVLAEVSGLSEAVQQSARTALEYDYDPALAKLAHNLERVGAAERRAIAEMFLRRIESDPLVTDMLTSNGGRSGHPVRLNPDDARRLVRLIAYQTRTSLVELGMTDHEVTVLAEIGNAVCAPLADLAELYMHPHTMSQQVRRYWRLQRVGLKLLQIIARPPEALRLNTEARI